MNKTPFLIKKPACRIGLSSIQEGWQKQNMYRKDIEAKDEAIRDKYLAINSTIYGPFQASKKEKASLDSSIKKGKAELCG